MFTRLLAKCTIESWPRSPQNTCPRRPIVRATTLSDLSCLPCAVAVDGNLKALNVPDEIFEAFSDVSAAPLTAGKAVDPSS